MSAMSTLSSPFMSPSILTFTVVGLVMVLSAVSVSPVSGGISAFIVCTVMSIVAQAKVRVAVAFGAFSAFSCEPSSQLYSSSGVKK